MGLMVSFLVVVAIVAKMLRAIRLLDGRITLLQEQLNYGRKGGAKAAPRPAATRVPSGKTPIEGVPVLPPSARTPAPIVTRAEIEESRPFPGETSAHVIEQAEVDAVWARLEAEQERLKQAMGRDFQVRTPKRSAADVRGKPVVRAMSAQEIARKLERK